MYRFDIDINPVIAGKEIHLEGICEMISSNTFTVIMTRPFNGLTVTKHFGNIGEMDMDATFSKLYEQETKRIESK